MKFNILVKKQLLPILQKYDFVIEEEFENIVRFESPVAKVNLVFNDYDNSHLVEIGLRGGIFYPLNDSVVKKVFLSALPIDRITTEDFIKNLSLLFKQQEAVKILTGNITPLEGFVKEQASNYTHSLLQKQILDIAAKDWANNDYKAFLNNIDKIGVTNVPQSYQLKYKIAKQKKG